MPITTYKSAITDVLVIVFTSINHKLNIPLDEFFKASGLDEASKIIISDDTHKLSLGGIPPNFDSCDKLLNHLEDLIKEYNAKKVIMVGYSGGAHSALIFGHLLKVQEVICFSPYTYVSLEAMRKKGDPALHTMKRILENLDSLPSDLHEYFDLKNVLSNWNGTTEYFIHVSRYHKWDYKRALHLNKLPHVKIIPHPYNKHSLISSIHKDNKLFKCFNSPNEKYISIYQKIKILIPNLIRSIKNK